MKSANLAAPQQDETVHREPGTVEPRWSMDYAGFEGLARAIFEELDDALILLDLPSGRILDVNAATQRLCGIGPRNLLGKPLNGLVQFADPIGDELPLAGRKTQWCYSERACMLQTAVRGVWIPIDATVTQLAVKPARLALIRLKPISSPPTDQ